MPLFGTISLGAALAALLLSAAVYLFGGAASARAGRLLFALAAGGVFLAAGDLGWLLVNHHFEVKYVFEHSARAMAPLYWFPSFWSGQEGSFLLWAFWTSVLGLILAATAGKAERRVMPVYSAVLLFLLILLNVRSPFVLLDTGGAPVPTEGLGLNPNLENPWMVIHPPTLFLGFASIAVPFAFALAGLFWRDWDGWLRRALPWGLFGFSVLGLAMMMGGYWAYEMLGWGGFWAWDPVENGPFVPWVALVAFLHAAQIERVRGGFQRPTFFFALLPFIGVLYESFLTRSGVLSDFSVHSFSELGGSANGILLGGLVLSAVIALGTLAARSRAIPKGESTLESPTTREYGYTLAMVVLTLCAVIAAIGMSAPLLTKMGLHIGLTNHVATVKEDYHNRTMFPLAVLLAMGMGIAPYLAWRGKGTVETGRLTAWYAASVLGAVGFVALAKVLGTPLAGKMLMPQLLLFTANFFAVLANGALLIARLIPPRSEIGPSADGPRVRPALTVGGLLSHLGAAALLLGIVCLVTFVKKDDNLFLVKGLPQEVLDGRYRVTYLGQTGDYQTNRNNALQFDVRSKNGREHFVAQMPFALRAMEGGDKKLIGHPAISHHLGGDLYLSLKDGPNYFYPQGRFPLEIKLGGAKQMGGYGLELLRFERDPAAAAQVMATGVMPEKFPVWAVVRVTFHGQATVVRAANITYRDRPGAPESPEIALPGGYLLAFDRMNAGSADKDNPNAGAMSEGGGFVLRPPGAVMEGFQIDVSTRPMINLVWLGTLLMFLGGLLSARRRVLENRLEPVPDLPETAPARRAAAKRRSAAPALAKRSSS